MPADLTTAELVDSDGAPLKDGALYLDKYGDTWRACFDATEFCIVAWADGRTFEEIEARCTPDAPQVVRRYEDAASVVASSGPMTLLGAEGGGTGV